MLSPENGMNVDVRSIPFFDSMDFSSNKWISESKEFMSSSLQGKSPLIDFGFLIDLVWNCHGYDEHG